MSAAVTRPRRFLLPLVCLAPLLANADAGLVVLALPDIQRELSMSLTEAHWVTNVYVLLVGGLQLLGGRLCDRHAARGLLRGSLMAFAVTSACCAVAPTGWVLLSARAGQAVAAAVLVPAAMCVLLTVATEDAQRRAGLALWAACGGIGSVAGVLVGGLAATHLGWRWAFLLNVPLALGALAGSRRLEPGEQRRPRGTSVAAPGALLLVSTLLTLVYGLVSIAEQGFGLSTCALLAVAVVLGGSLIRCEARSRQPLIPVVLLKDHWLAAGALGILFVAAATGPVVFMGSVYLREAHGYTAWMAGCALLPVVGGVIVVGRWSSRLLGRYGPHLSCLVGCGLTGSGLVWLASLAPDSGYPTGVLPGLVLVGAGLPVLWMSCELAAVSTVGRPAVGTAAGVVQSAGQIGAALGLALAVTVYSRTVYGTAGPTDPAALTEGATRTFWCCAVLMLCVALTAQLGLRPGRSLRVGPAHTSGGTGPFRGVVRGRQKRLGERPTGGLLWLLHEVKRRGIRTASPFSYLVPRTASRQCRKKTVRAGLGVDAPRTATMLTNLVIPPNATTWSAADFPAGMRRRRDRRRSRRVACAQDCPRRARRAGRVRRAEHGRSGFE